MEEKRTMRKIRDWLYNKFLPWETKEIYQREVAMLRGTVDKQRAKINEMQAYIDGVHDVIRQRTRIEIKNEVSK